MLLPTSFRKNKPSRSPTSTEALFTTAERWKHLIVRQKDGWRCTYMHAMDYYSAIKKEWNSDLRSNMDGPRGCHTEWSQRERNPMILLTCGILKPMIQTNLFTKQKQTHRLREWTGGWWGRGGQGGVARELVTQVGTDIFKTESQQGPTVQHRDRCSIYCKKKTHWEKKRYTSMYKWITLLNTWNKQHS